MRPSHNLSVDTGAPELVRYWFEFDLADHAPPPEGVRLDGGDATYRLLGRGAGVTGYDETDCLSLIERQLGQQPPPLTASVRNPSIPADQARQIGNAAWRGIWFPPLNLSGPVVGG